MSLRPNAFKNNEISFVGKPLTPGIAMGTAYLLKRVDLLRLIIDKSLVDLISVEIARLDFAISRTKNQILRFIRISKGATEKLSSPIFEAELHFLEDPAFIITVKETIERTGLHGETVLAEEIAKLQEKALHCTDDFTSKSLVTMQDLYYRLLYNMLPGNESRIGSIRNIPQGSILIADRLSPVEMAVVPVGTVIGILIEESSPYSHASIMAKSIGVPVVIDFSGIGSFLDETTKVLIDANRGFVFLNPTEATIKECHDLENHSNPIIAPLTKSSNESTVSSADGKMIHVSCNASTIADMQLARSQGISEIGLFRTEIRYLTNTVMPSDEHEKTYYKSILTIEGISKVTIRLLDIGGDKLPLFLQMAKETDPQLGCRGIRFLLSRPDFMKKQLRAIFAGNTTGSSRILLPLVTTLDDILESREIINEVLLEESSAGQTLELGIMVEVPSVAYSIEKFLPKVDFISLGTNDLIQYFFAANRDQFDLQKYNKFTHPAFLKMLSDILLVCNTSGKVLTVCGEMASDPVGCSLLAALGATHVSIQPDSIATVRQSLSVQNISRVQEILPTLFNYESAEEVEDKIKTFGI
jgi:phosphotransferase system enzyme I (PtsI)